jgi:hypothetical protein
MQAYAPLMNRIKEGYNNLQSEITYASNTIIPGTPNTEKEYLSDSQAAQLYKSKVKDNPDVDANKIVDRERAKIPKVIAREKQAFDFFGPINHGVGMLTKKVEQGAADVGSTLFKRGVSNQQQPHCYYTPSVAWLQVTSDDYRLSVQLVGDISPGSNCIGDVPIFIDGNPGQASELLPDYRVNDNKINVLDLTGSTFVAKKCKESGSMNCVVPDANSNSTNEQIDSLLDQSQDAYIYLSKNEMDDWLASKKPGKETDSLRYIRLSPKSDDGMQRTTLGGIIASSIIGTGLLVIGAVTLYERFGGSKRSPLSKPATTATTTATTTVPKTLAVDDSSVQISKSDASSSSSSSSLSGSTSSSSSEVV